MIYILKLKKSGILILQTIKETTEIYIKAADKTFVFRSCQVYGGDLKIEIHKAKCTCKREKPSKLHVETEKHLLDENRRRGIIHRYVAKCLKELLKRI